MNNLKQIDFVDNSGIVINYESYSFGTWSYSQLHFKCKETAEEFLDKINRDFKLRLISVEKRTILYEKYITE